MRTRKIWMVGGTTGEYSDRTEWVVDAWPTEELAQARVLELKRLMVEAGVQENADYEKRMAAEDKMRAHDPAFSCDYTGTEYYICELELKEP